jgi:hypothetical protein
MYNKLRFQFVVTAAVLCFCSLSCLLAQDQAENSIQVIASFDYPLASGFTTCSGIDDRGDVAGYYFDASGDFRGFVRFQNGRFSEPIVAPNDSGGVTYASDIHNGPTVCGESYDSANNAFHGYFLTNQIFTLFDVEGAGSTTVAGLNAYGHFVGSFGPDSSSTQGYLDVAGEITVVSIPGATATFGTAINSLDETVGNYISASDSALHGFFRNAAGDLTYPIDPPGSTLTSLRGINTHGLVVGNYNGSDSRSHGLAFKSTATFLTFNYPAADLTTLGGVNERGLICGDYVDSSGIRHGFIAKFR